MTGGDATHDLQAFIDERWAVAQPRFYPGVPEGPRVPAEVTPRDADFLAAVTSHGDEPPLLVVDDDRKERSDRYPRLSDGSPRGYLFFEEPGRLRLETIVGWAAIARLRYEFGWPREPLAGRACRARCEAVLGGGSLARRSRGEGDSQDARQAACWDARLSRRRRPAHTDGSREVLRHRRAPSAPLPRNSSRRPGVSSRWSNVVVERS